MFDSGVPVYQGCHGILLSTKCVCVWIYKSSYKNISSQTQNGCDRIYLYHLKKISQN